MWGVGSGFFLDHAQFASAAPRIVLMDMSRGRAGLRGTAPLALQPRDTDSLLEGDGFEPSVPAVAMTGAFGSATNIIELRVSCFAPGWAATAPVRV